MELVVGPLPPQTIDSSHLLPHRRLLMKFSHTDDAISHPGGERRHARGEVRQGRTQIRARRPIKTMKFRKNSKATLRTRATAHQA